MAATSTTLFSSIDLAQEGVGLIVAQQKSNAYLKTTREEIISKILAYFYIHNEP